MIVSFFFNNVIFVLLNFLVCFVVFNFLSNECENFCRARVSFRR